MSTVPSWLTDYVASKPARTAPRQQYEPTDRPGIDIEEPRPWEYDGDLKRRVEVHDHNWTPPRLVRRCGYQRCMCCIQPFWSDDVVRVRLCDQCKRSSFQAALDNDLREAVRNGRRAKKTGLPA